VADARETFQLRLRALADAHDVLTSNNWEAADLRDVLERTLLPYRDGWSERFVLSGPDLLLQSRAALAVGLAVHELATNAAKYGALTAERGQVVILGCQRSRAIPPHLDRARRAGCIGPAAHRLRLAADPERLYQRIERLGADGLRATGPDLHGRCRYARGRRRIRLAVGRISAWRHPPLAWH
jgi:hypothetical protein